MHNHGHDMSTYIFNVKDFFGLQSKVCLMCHQDNQLVFKKSTDSSKYQEKGKLYKTTNSGTCQNSSIPFISCVSRSWFSCYVIFFSM